RRRRGDGAGGPVAEGLDGQGASQYRRRVLGGQIEAAGPLAPDTLGARMARGLGDGVIAKETRAVAQLQGEGPRVEVNHCARSVAPVLVEKLPLDPRRAQHDGV